MNLLQQFAQTTSTATCTVNGQAVECGEAGGIFAGIGLFILLISLPIFIFTVWMFIHALSHNSPKKVMWALLILFLGFIPAVIYFFTERKKDYSQPAMPTAQPGPMTNSQEQAPQQQPAPMPAQAEQPSAPQAPENMNIPGPEQQPVMPTQQPSTTPDQPAENQNQQPPQAQ